MKIANNVYVTSSVLKLNGRGAMNHPRGVSESMDRRGCAILALEVVPKNLIFT